MVSRRWDKLDNPSWLPSSLPTDHWSGRLEAARRNDSGDIRLRSLTDSKVPISIKSSDLTTHMHVVGATGGGKSFFLESIIRQLIVRGDGICLLDPHGDLYHRILSFCAYLNTKRPELNLARRIIPFDIAETKNTLGFNPVQRNATVMTYQVVALMEAIRKSWGQT